MGVPGSYEFGPDWDAEELCGPEEAALGPDELDDDDLPPDPAIDERDLMEPPS